MSNGGPTESVISIPTPLWVVRPLSCISYVVIWPLLFTVFVLFVVVSIPATVLYYTVDRFNDGPVVQDLTVMVTPNSTVSSPVMSATASAILGQATTSPAVITGRQSRVEATGIVVTHPRQLFYTTKPYSITLSSSPILTQATTLRLHADKNVIVDPGQTTVFTFTPHIQQTYGINISNVVGTGDTTLEFERLSPPASIPVTLVKEAKWLGILRELLVITSINQGIIPIIISAVLIIFPSVVRKQEEIIQQERRKTERDIGKLRRIATEMQDLSGIATPLLDRPNLLPEERVEIEHLITPNPQLHMNYLQNNQGPWILEHIGRLLNLRDFRIVTIEQINDLIKGQNIPITTQQRSRLVYYGRISNPHPLERAEPRLPPGFKQGSERAEQDDPGNFIGEVLSPSQQPKQLYALLVEHKTVTSPQPIHIYGLPGSGKTALLRAIMHEGAEAQPPLFPILINLNDRALNIRDFLLKGLYEPQQREDIIRAMTSALCEVLRLNPHEWMNLSENGDMKNQVARLLGQYAQNMHKELIVSVKNELRTAGEELEELLREEQAKQPLSRKQPLREQIGQIVVVIQQLGYKRILVCLDDAPASLDTLVTQQELSKLLNSQIALQVALAVSYSSKHNVPPLSDENDQAVIHLGWKPDQLRRLLKKRLWEDQDGSVSLFGDDGEAVQDQLVGDKAGNLGVIRVPRDFWPWWAALNDDALRPPANGEVTIQQWQQIEPFMKQARAERDKNASNWTMEDYKVALELYKQNQAKPPATA